MSDKQFQILLKGCIQRNGKSQEVLYKTLFSYAMNVCLRYIDNRELAFEVVNDCFVKIFKGIHEFKAPEKNSYQVFRGWLRKIVIHTAIDCFRANRKHGFAQELTSKIEADYIDDDRVISDLSYAELLQLIQQLSPAYQKVFTLYVIDGFTHEEIGEWLGISEGTSKSNLAKARINLREMLKRNNHESYARYVR